MLLTIRALSGTTYNYEYNEVTTVNDVITNVVSLNSIQGDEFRLIFRNKNLTGETLISSLNINDNEYIILFIRKIVPKNRQNAQINQKAFCFWEQRRAPQNFPDLGFVLNDEKNKISDIIHKLIRYQSKDTVDILTKEICRIRSETENSAYIEEKISFFINAIMESQQSRFMLRRRILDDPTKIILFDDDFIFADGMPPQEESGIGMDVLMELLSILNHNHNHHPMPFEPNNNFDIDSSDELHMFDSDLFGHLEFETSDPYSSYSEISSDSSTSSDSDDS